jgi:hypothetical protein
MHLKRADNWFKKDFCPEAKRYCKRKNGTYNALLLLDNAPSPLPPITHLDGNIKVIFLPLNTTSLGQAGIATFKKLYLKLPFNVTFTAVNNPHHDFCMVYTILGTIINIQAAWAVLSRNPLWLVSGGRCGQSVFTTLADLEKASSRTPCKSWG